MHPRIEQPELSCLEFFFFLVKQRDFVSFYIFPAVLFACDNWWARYGSFLGT